MTTIKEILDQKRRGWPMGACSLYHKIEDYSGTCGRCGWSIEDHEYLTEEDNSTFDYDPRDDETLCGSDE